jgi:NAD(P)-dependent dehydrogenase (short-subunit alcohol dehydrogenase family)
MVGSYVRTADGFEATMQGNHLAPFLLAHLLRPALRDGRVVNTSSRMHERARLDPDDFTGSADAYSSWRAYAASKAANVLFAAEAARRWPEITSVSFHPGVVRSNFGVGAVTRFFYRFTPFLTTPEQAGDLLTWLSTEEVTDGAYYVGRRATPPGPAAADPALAAPPAPPTAPRRGWWCSTRRAHRRSRRRRARRRGRPDRQLADLRRGRRAAARADLRRPPGRHRQGRRRPWASAKLGGPRPEFVREHTGQAIGGVAPLGHPKPVRTLVDTALAGIGTT